MIFDEFLEFVFRVALLQTEKRKGSMKVRPCAGWLYCFRSDSNINMLTHPGSMKEAARIQFYIETVLFPVANDVMPIASGGKHRCNCTAAQTRASSFLRVFCSVSAMWCKLRA